MPLFHFRETCFTFYRHSATADRQRRQRETNRGWSTPPLISGGGGRAGLKFADGIISRWTITARRKTFENSEFRASSQRRRHASSRNESVYQLARKYEVRKRIIRVRDASSKLPPPSSSGIDERQHHPSSYGASGVTTERGKNILLRKGVGTPPSLPSLSRLSMAWSASYRKTPLPIPSSFYDFRERIIHAERHGRLYTGRKLNHEFVRFVRKVCRDRMGWERMHWNAAEHRN